MKRDRLIPCAFAVRAIPGKDVGVVAARDLRRGERILKERPAMTARTTEDHAASALDASDAPDFWDLHDCHAVGETKTVLGICRTNCFELRDPATGDTRSGMFLLGSRFNHDCSPNVHRTWLPDEGVEVYHALRDVPEGAELCGEYIPLYYSTAKRREMLRKYDFVCGCAACASGRGDAEREAFERTYRALYAAPPTDAGALGKIEALLALAETAFDGSPATNRRVLHDAVIIALAQGRRPLAKSYMARLYDAQRLSSGDTAVTRAFATYVDDVARFKPSD